jgi:hypothetical protein
MQKSSFAKVPDDSFLSETIERGDSPCEFIYIKLSP